MVGMFQIVIYALCLHLIFKGVQIYQSAYVSTADETIRKKGMNTGIFCIIAAFAATAILVYLSESLAFRISGAFDNLVK